MRVKSILIMAAAGWFAVTNAAVAQAPPVGPIRCVTCSGGGGGGGGSRGAAIGSAIGMGLSIGGALMRQQMQQSQESQSRHQSEEQHGRHDSKRATREQDKSEKQASKNRETQSDKTKKDEDKGKNQEEKTTKQETKQPEPDKAKNQETAKEAKKPADNSRWSGCTGNVGTVWNAGNCGSPSGPTSAAQGAASQGASRATQIPFSVAKLAPVLLEKLACPDGSQPAQTFYGGTRCSPPVSAEIKAPAPPQPSPPEQDTTRTYGRPTLIAVMPAPDESEIELQFKPDTGDFRKCMTAAASSNIGKKTADQQSGPICAAAANRLRDHLQAALKDQKTWLRGFAVEEIANFRRDAAIPPGHKGDSSDPDCDIRNGLWQLMQECLRDF